MALPRVYFYCRNEEGNLQEDVITLAEGLRELGVPYSGNCDYWLESTTPGDYLIRHDPQIHPEDCDVVVVSYTWPYWIRMKTFDLVRRPLPEGLFRPGRKYRTVYMDSHDGHRTVSWEPEFRQFDLILRSKLNRRAWHPENMFPWVLGFSNRVILETKDALQFSHRRQKILWNFGASHPFSHTVRECAKIEFLPQISSALPVDETKDDLGVVPADTYEALMWRQTGARFSRAYYDRLKNTQAVACFCGDLIPPAPFRDPDRYLVGGNRARFWRQLYGLLGKLDTRPLRIVQWDSFRFWEGLSAGCLVIHVDLKHYGADMPVLPNCGQHYIGIRFDRPREFVERLMEDTESLGRIAEAGKSWAMQKYSPRNMAERFLVKLEQLSC